MCIYILVFILCVWYTHSAQIEVGEQPVGVESLLFYPIGSAH